MKLLSVALSASFIVGVLAVAAPVGAEPAAKLSAAQVIGTVKIDPSNPTVATVHARYVCSGEGHLWVSVKQTADRSADPRLSQEGSSAISAAWSDSHRNAVTCDGKWHTDTFAVDQLERPAPNTFGALAKGKAWVQFCLFDATTTTDPISSMVFTNMN